MIAQDVECAFVQLPNNGRWHCPVCDPDKERTAPVDAHRACRKTLVEMVAEFDNLIAAKKFTMARKVAEQIQLHEFPPHPGGCGKQKKSSGVKDVDRV